jgi:hypothetical protein
MLCLLRSVACCCSDKQAIDCLKQAGWSVEGGIEVFFSLGMQGGSVLDTRAMEQLYLKYKGAPAAAAVRSKGRYGGTCVCFECAVAAGRMCSCSR